MKRITQKFLSYLQKALRRVTIKQANMLTTLVIFLFTILFAYLLIIENYQDYERTLLSAEYQLDTEEHKQKLKAILIKNTIAIATLAFILFAIVIGFYKIFHDLLQKDIKTFLDFFAQAAHKEEVLSPHAMFFQDFKNMVGHANSMLGTISEQKKSLSELNQTLEEKVRRKTESLQKSNAELLEEKRFSEELVKRQREFLRHTIHETNTPLSVILTSIELFSMQNGKDRHLSKIEAAAKNIFNIYDDLSYLVKKDQIEYPKTAINFSEFVKSRLDFFSEVAELSKIKFAFESNTNDAFVYFNETKLQRVIDNNITNGIKYTLVNETVYLTIERSLGYVDFIMASRSKEIRDREKIFEVYYREEVAQDGFGIGLGLVRSICDEEGVAISVKCEAQKNIFSYRFKVMGV